MKLYFARYGIPLSDAKIYTADVELQDNEPLTTKMKRRNDMKRREIQGYPWWRLPIAVVLILAGPSAWGVEIIHDAGRDLVLNTACASVFTNAAGGVWSFMRSGITVDGDHVSLHDRTLLSAVYQQTYSGRQAVRSGTDPEDVVLQRGPGKGSSSLPAFTVNPTAWLDDQNSMRGTGYPEIPPGQISCHPGRLNEAASKVCVLRFTMPRTGIYAVTAKVWEQNKGKRGVALLVNGEVRKSRVTWTGSEGTTVQTNDFSLVAAAYQAGDYVELTVDGNGSYNSNATGLKFEVTETVEAVIDAGTSLATHLAARGTSASAAFTNALEGVWRAEAVGDVNRQAETYLGRTLLGIFNYSDQSAKEAGLLGWKLDASAVPFAYVNATGGYVTETNASGVCSWYRGSAVVPNEILLHPAKDKPVLLGLSPATSGIYDVGITIRDFNWGNKSGMGVEVTLLQGGHVLGHRRIAAEGEVDGVTVPASGTLFLPAVAVAAHVPLEVVVNPLAAIDSDTTALTWCMVKRAEARGVYSANGAMRANLLSETPQGTFTGDGAAWQVGIRADDGTWTPFTQANKGTLNGHAANLSLSTATLPWFGVNLADRALVGSDMRESANSSVYVPAGRDMLLAHPSKNGVTTALRFVAPENGVYSVKSFFEDLDAGAGDGVKICVFAKRRLAVETDPVCSSKEIGIGSVSLNVPAVELAAGDVVDFVVHPNETVGNGHTCDLTGGYIWLEWIDRYNPPGTILLFR